MNILDYRLPAEFESHKATWLLWPNRPDNWRSRAYFGQNDLLALAGLISNFEPVRLGVPESEAPKIRRRLPPEISLVEIDFDDIWVRDTGPTIIVANGSPSIAINWRFNSWGGLFSESTQDSGVAAKIACYEMITSRHAPIVFEGGALTCNGQGTIITTEECVLSPNRNPGLTRAGAEDIFREFLNVQKVIWLPFGLLHDEAGGHVDNVCAFASDNIVLIATTNDRNHPSYDRLRAAKDILSQSANAEGAPISLIEVPIPDATYITQCEAEEFAPPKGEIVRLAGSPLAPSHINFYSTARAVFVPTFNGSSDDPALRAIGTAFPNRQIIPFHSRDFLLGGGAIHCLTKEIPF